VTYEHWTQNVDYPELNDKSVATVEGNRLTVALNDTVQTYTFTGTPLARTHVEFAELTKDEPLCPEDPRHLAKWLGVEIV